MTLEEAFRELWVYRKLMQTKWPTPPQIDCLRFAMTEAAEALDAQLRQNPAYHRNTDRDRDFVEEIADTAMMLMTALGPGNWSDDINKPGIWKPSAERLCSGVATCMMTLYASERHVIESGIFLWRIVDALRIANALVPDLGDEVVKRLERKAERLGFSRA